MANGGHGNNFSYFFTSVLMCILLHEPETFESSYIAYTDILCQEFAVEIQRDIRVLGFEFLRVADFQVDNRQNLHMSTDCSQLAI